MNKLIKFLIFLLLVLPSVCIAEVCEFKGFQIANYAYQKGLQFTYISTGEASCTISSHKAGASAASNGNGQCIIDFFVGKNMSEPWEVRDISYLGKGFSIVIPPNKGDSSLYTRVKLTPDSSGTASFLITKVILKGTNCSNWQDIY